MSIFDINYPVLINWLTPTRKRKPKRLAFLNVLIAPVVFIYNLFKGCRKNNLYDLSHTSQVVCLQAVLNDVFDNTLRRITITDNLNTDPAYTYLNAEQKPLCLYTVNENQPVYLFKDSEAGSGSNFIVQVPSAIVYDPAYMAALILNYKLPGTTYTIINV